MKFVVLILLSTLHVQADDLVCTLLNKEFVKIYGLSRTVENHEATLEFNRSFYPAAIMVDVRTTKFEEFVDWNGQGVKMDRLFEASILPYPTIHFKIELAQSIGGHCEQFGCEQSAKFYHNDQVKVLVCKLGAIQNVFALPRTNVTSSILKSSSDDWCLSTCNRGCLEKPIFCGSW